MVKRKVLLEASETAANLIQVAVIYLKAGEYLLEDKGRKIRHIPMATKHNIRLIKNIEYMAIGYSVKD